MIRIHKDFPGGNIAVAKQVGNEVYLVNELRDTGDEVTDWFYWAFCIEGAENQEITFHMQENRLGYWGPAVSHDFVSWEWLGSCDGNSFTYRFSKSEEKVYFAHHILYPAQRFFDLTRRYDMPVKELCVSKKGRSVPCLQFGQGTQTVLLTARHHACESTGSYVLEGVLEEILSAPLPDARILCVPFVDYDGVLEGDQGKARSPHDHNRDYIDAPIYPETTAIWAFAEQYGCNFGFDFHSPWHRGQHNDTIFIVRNSIEKTAVYDRFGALWEAECDESTMDYRSQNDYPPCTDWNQPCACFGCTMQLRPECKLAVSLENAYFGTEGNVVSAQRLVSLGKAFARALRRFMAEQT